ADQLVGHPHENLEALERGGQQGRLIERATSPSVIWAPSATNPAVTPLTTRHPDRAGAVEHDRAAARNELACWSGCTGQVGYRRLNEGARCRR
ncbi:MAG: hypothetical protein U5N53_10535, partial [Mycobacterium sp.]|nr:hypothetical protein [Mycobacterium sp.]